MLLSSLRQALEGCSARHAHNRDSASLRLGCAMLRPAHAYVPARPGTATPPSTASRDVLSERARSRRRKHAPRVTHAPLPPPHALGAAVLATAATHSSRCCAHTARLPQHHGPQASQPCCSTGAHCVPARGAHTAPLPHLAGANAHARAPTTHAPPEQAVHSSSSSYVYYTDPRTVATTCGHPPSRWHTGVATRGHSPKLASNKRLRVLFGPRTTPSPRRGGGGGDFAERQGVGRRLVRVARGGRALGPEAGRQVPQAQAPPPSSRCERREEARQVRPGRGGANHLDD